MSPDYDVIVIGFRRVRRCSSPKREGVSRRRAREGRPLAPGGLPAQQLAFAKIIVAPAFRPHWPRANDRTEERPYSIGFGVGGGSLIYGNVLYEPLEQFYNDPANHG